MAHILVVDDDADLRQLLLTALERDGHQVTALDRGSAVTEAHCRWAHCILLDVMMPGEDGFATCQRVRALADCPILFLTAKTEEADVIQGLGLGGDDYLTKPFRLGELRARVAAHLRRQHRTPQHRFRRGGLDFDLGEKAVLGRAAGEAHPGGVRHLRIPGPAQRPDLLQGTDLRGGLRL